MAWRKWFTINSKRKIHLANTKGKGKVDLKSWSLFMVNVVKMKTHLNPDSVRFFPIQFPRWDHVLYIMFTWICFFWLFLYFLDIDSFFVLFFLLKKFSSKVVVDVLFSTFNIHMFFMYTNKIIIDDNWTSSMAEGATDHHQNSISNY